MIIIANPMQFDNYYKYKMSMKVRSKSTVSQGKVLKELQPKTEPLIPVPPTQVVDQASLPFYRIEDQSFLDELLERKNHDFCEHLNGFDLVDMTFEINGPSVLPPGAAEALEAWNKQSPFMIEFAETTIKVDFVDNSKKVFSQDTKKVEVAVESNGSKAGEVKIQLISFDDVKEKPVRKVRFSDDVEIFVFENVVQEHRVSDQVLSKWAKFLADQAAKAKAGGEEKKTTHSSAKTCDTSGWTRVTSGRNKHNSRRKLNAVTCIPIS